VIHKNQFEQEFLYPEFFQALNETGPEEFYLEKKELR
jgi:hypothetical protein